MMQKTTGFIPIFHDKDIFFHFIQKELPLDDQGLYRPLEMMLMPGAEFEIMNIYEKGVCQIKLKDQKKYYLFLDMLDLNFKDLGQIQDEQQILTKLLSFQGCPYVWGSNWILNSDQWCQVESCFSSYPENFIKNMKYLFSGIDCSGLLYAATLGQLPRNTSELIHFGNFIDINGLSNQHICQKVRPLDLLVWKGHVLAFLDENTLIESRKDFGCVIVDAKNRLEEIRQTRIPSSEIGEDRFYVKRWLASS
jgi:hypothetical protein